MEACGQTLTEVNFWLNKVRYAPGTGEGGGGGSENPNARKLCLPLKTFKLTKATGKTLSGMFSLGKGFRYDLKVPQVKPATFSDLKVPIKRVFNKMKCKFGGLITSKCNYLNWKK